MEVEINVLRDEMKANGGMNTVQGGNLTFYEGTISGKAVVLVKSGVGKVNAALCTQRLILQFGVTMVLNTGIAGGMENSLKIFDFVVSTSAVYHDMDATAFGYKATQIPQMEVSDFPADETMVNASVLAFSKIDKPKNNKIIKGRIATGDQFIADKTAKAHIAKVANPACVEMEGAAIAHACFVNKIPFAILRCISDNADESYESTYSFNEEIAANESAELVKALLKEL